jgi:tetratricopeptide (TPR) repeat protein
MIKKITSLIALVILLNACKTGETETKEEGVKTDSNTTVVLSGDCNTLLSEAKRIDVVLQKENSVNSNLAEQAINAFNNFASVCKDDSLAPIFLLKAGQIAQSVGKFQQSEILLKKCADEFPNFRNRGAALFLLAQVYDDPALLNNESEAKKIYEQIIKEYPKTAWSRDAEACIKNLGKTDAQLVEEFLKKNKK